MATAERRARRRRARARRRKLGLLVAVVAGAAVVGAVLGARHSTRSHGAAAHAVASRRSRRRSAPALTPPGPIPGYLLIADRGNDRMLLVDSAHHVYWRYPQHGRAPGMPFRFDDDTFFGPSFDRIISNQEDQHTIQIISFPGGRVLWRYGHVNVRGSAAGYLNTPDDAYLLPNGIVTVADAYNCRVLFIDHAHRVVKEYGTASVCRHDPPTELGAVNGATPLADGGTLVSEINGSWIDDISAGGKLRWSVQAPVSYPSDPQLIGPGRILLADYARPGHALIMTSRGRVLWRYGPSSGPGMLDHPSLAFRIAPGLVAINDDYRDRVVIVDLHEHRIVWQYGHTDHPGTAPGYLNTPDGLDLLRTEDARRSPTLRALLRAPAASHRVVSQASPTQGSILVRAALPLPAPVARAAAAADGGTILVAGGLSAAGVSTNGVFALDPATGRLRALGSVPQPFHDAAGAVIGGRLFVFGGGSSASSSAVQMFDPSTRRGSIVAHLPRPLSDLASATLDGTVYLVGGYDGTRPRPEIYATTDGRRFRLVGRLPQGLRYPAVAGDDGRLVIAGGTLRSGTSDAVYALDPRTGHVTRLATLPQPVAHAAAVTVGSSVYVLGGTSAEDVTVGSVTRVDPGTRAVVSLRATAPVSDSAVAQLSHTAYLVGGSVSGRAVRTVRVVSR